MQRVGRRPRSTAGETPITERSSPAQRAQFAGQLQDKVSAHRVADQRHRLQAVLRDEEVHHREHVVGEPGVVERRRKRLGAAAVAHVHADDVAARAPQLVRVADDILRVRRAFEPMHDDGRGPRRANLLRLPVAMAENLARDLVRGRRRDLDQLRFGCRQAVDARQIVAGDGLQMSVAQKTPRTKLRGVSGDGSQAPPSASALPCIARAVRETQSR